jgi:hypothetical protein
MVLRKPKKKQIKDSNFKKEIVAFAPKTDKITLILGYLVNMLFFLKMFKIHRNILLTLYLR